MDRDSTEKRARGRPRDWHDKTAQNTIKSLDRAIAVLDHLSEVEAATLSQLATDLNQSAATVYRILVTLEGRGIVDFDGQSQTWHIGAQAFLIGARFLRRTSLVERARPILRRLMEVTGETANLGIERDGQVLFVSQVETHATIRAFFPPGTVSAMHASGIGKALLAQRDAARRHQIIMTHDLTQYTPHTLADPDVLKADLDRIALRGYAIDAEERNIGMQCIAAPIFDVHGEAIAGISVSGPTSRIMAAGIATLSEQVVLAAADLTAAMGWRTPTVK